jgi:hypothetical protein
MSVTLLNLKAADFYSRLGYHSIILIIFHLTLKQQKGNFSLHRSYLCGRLIIRTYRVEFTVQIITNTRNTEKCALNVRKFHGLL